MQTRQRRGQALAQTCQIEQIENIWSIPRNQVMSYAITKIGETYACTCKDFEYRNHSLTDPVSG